jgi:hypothetical protein
VQAVELLHTQVTRYRRLSFLHFPLPSSPVLHIVSTTRGMGSPFSFVCSWCCKSHHLWILKVADFLIFSTPHSHCFFSRCSGCFESDAEEGGDSHSKGLLGDGTRSSKYAKDHAGRATSNYASNAQMQPTLPPLPELRPLEPLEPFNGMRNSIDPEGSSSGSTLVGKAEKGFPSKSWRGCFGW